MDFLETLGAFQTTKDSKEVEDAWGGDDGRRLQRKSSSPPAAAAAAFESGATEN